MLREQWHSNPLFPGDAGALGKAINRMGGSTPDHTRSLTLHDVQRAASLGPPACLSVAEAAAAATPPSAMLVTDVQLLLAVSEAHSASDAALLLRVPAAPTLYAASLAVVQPMPPAWSGNPRWTAAMMVNRRAPALEGAGWRDVVEARAAPAASASAAAAAPASASASAASAAPPPPPPPPAGRAGPRHAAHRHSPRRAAYVAGGLAHDRAGAVPVRCVPRCDGPSGGGRAGAL
jgi:hypothetical protein